MFLGSTPLHRCGRCYCSMSRVRVWLRPCVLFALGEVRRHAWTALRCLTVVFSRCHWLGCARPCWWYYLLWAPAEWVEKRAEPPRPPEPCHSRLPRHLIVRKVSAGPSGPRASTASLSAGQTERHSVLGPGSFFPFSHRLCLISSECKGRKCQITGEPLQKKNKNRGVQRQRKRHAPVVSLLMTFLFECLN